MSITHSASARVFFALWPDEPVRKALTQWAKQLHKICGGRLTRPETIHLTLVFLGDVAVSRFDDLKQIAAQVSVPAFDWKVDVACCWRRNKIAWAGTSAVPEALAQLVSELETRLKNEGFVFELRPYVPHITLLRHARCVPELPQLEPVSWPAREFVLVQSLLQAGGSEYQVIGSWALRPVSAS